MLAGCESLPAWVVLEEALCAWRSRKAMHSRPRGASIREGRNNNADRTIVAGYSGDDPPVPHMGASNMFIIPMLVMVFEAVVLMVTPVVLLFALAR